MKLHHSFVNTLYKSNTVLTTILHVMSESFEFRHCSLQNRGRIGAGSAERYLLLITNIALEIHCPRRLTKGEHAVSYCDLASVYAGLPFFHLSLEKKKFIRHNLISCCVFNFFGGGEWGAFSFLV